jgi:hypothetical protein
MFHTDLMHYEVDYEYTKKLVIHKMRNINLVNPYPLEQSCVTTTLSSSSSSSISLVDRVSTFKKNLLNSANVKMSSSLSSQPLSIDSEIFIFVSLVRENDGVEFQWFWKANSGVLPRLS